MKNFIYLSIIVSFVISCSSPVEINHYSIEYRGNYSKSAPQIDKNVAIENFTSPIAIRKSEIILRTTDQHQISYAANDLWWALPQEMVGEAFQEYLDAKKIFRRVLPYPTPYSTDYIVEGSLKKFEIQIYDESWKVVVAIKIRLIDHESKAIIWDPPVYTSAVNASNDVEGAAKKMEQALGKIFDKVAIELKGVITDGRNP